MLDLFGTEKLRQEREKNSRNLVILTSISAFVGAVTALLFSPASGKENRTFLANKGKEAYDAAKHASEDATKSFQKLETDLKSKFDELKSTIDKKIGNKDEVRLVEEEGKDSKK